MNWARLGDPSDTKAQLESSRPARTSTPTAPICHIEAGGGNAMIDLEFTTCRRDQMRVIGVTPQHESFGIADPKLIAPPSAGSIRCSIMRMSTRGRGQMPPLASGRVDEQAIQMLREWINSACAPRAQGGKSMRRSPLQDAIEMGLISGACAAFALLMFSGPFVEVFGADVLTWMTIPAIHVGMLAGWGAWARNRGNMRIESRNAAAIAGTIYALRPENARNVDECLSVVQNSMARNKIDGVLFFSSVPLLRYSRGRA